MPALPDARCHLDARAHSSGACDYRPSTALRPPAPHGSGFTLPRFTWACASLPCRRVRQAAGSPWTRAALPGAVFPRGPGRRWGCAARGVGGSAVTAVCPGFPFGRECANFCTMAPVRTCTVCHPPQNRSFIHKLESQSEPAHHGMCVCVCVCFNCKKKKLTLRGKIAFGQNSGT